MAESRLKIVIDALNLARGQAVEIERELRGLEGQSKKTSGALELLGRGKAIFTDLTGAAAGFAGTWKAALELGKSGAQLDLMDSKFDKLAVSIYTTGDNLESKLNAVMGGTVSKAAQVESAVTLMNLGLAKTEGEVIRMSSVSQKLNWDMQILGLTIANESTMRLDALGLSIEDVASRQKNLVAQGMSTSQAFREAVIAAGEAKAELLGLTGQTDNSTLAFARFEASITNIADGLKRRLAPGLASAFEAGALLLTWTEKIEAAQKTHADQVALTATSYDEYAREVIRAQNSQMGMIITDEQVNLLLTDLNNNVQETADGWRMLTREQWDQVKATESMRQAIEQANQAFKGVTYGSQSWAASLKGITGGTVLNTEVIKAQEAALTDLKAAIQGAVSNEYEQFIERQADLKGRAAEVRAEMDKLKSSHGAVVKEQIKNEMSSNDLALAQLKLKSAQEQLSRATDPMKQAELRVEVENLAEKIGSANKATQTYVDNSKRISELKTEYDKVNAEIDKNAQAHEAATKRIILGFLEQRLAVDGWSRKEIDAYQQVARQLGLVDDATWNMIGGINDALSSLETGSMDEFLAKISAIKNQSLGLPSSNPLPPPTGGGGGIPAYAAGGSFMVPEGYPNDSYFMRVSSGERVTVQPSSSVNNYYHNNRGGDTYIVNDARAWAMIQAQRRQAALQERYG